MTTRDNRFLTPRGWPHQGAYAFVNEDDTPHYMILQPVAAGTTDEQVQAALDNPGQVWPFLDDTRPAVSNEAVSPGQRITVDYDLPAGDYVLLCFVADVETGTPHAFMGMHLVVTLE